MTEYLYTDHDRDWDQDGHGGYTSACHRIAKRTPKRIYVEAWAPMLPVTDPDAHNYVGRSGHDWEIERTVSLDRATLEQTGQCRSKTAGKTFYVDAYEWR